MKATKLNGIMSTSASLLNEMAGCFNSNAFVDCSKCVAVDKGTQIKMSYHFMKQKLQKFSDPV